MIALSAVKSAHTLSRPFIAIALTNDLESHAHLPNTTGDVITHSAQ